MTLDRSRTTSATQLPRVLVVENNFSTVERLIRTFGDRRLDFDFDACTSVGNAVKKLLASPYQLVISGALLAEMDDFLLLKHTQEHKESASLVITASADEKKPARHILERGAFDLISIPLEHEQAVRTIQLALWQSRLKTLIACKERAIDKYRQHLGNYPDGEEKTEESFQRAIAAFESAITSIQGTILQIEQSTVCFSDFATRVEYYARKRALARLDSMP